MKLSLRYIFSIGTNLLNLRQGAAANYKVIATKVIVVIFTALLIFLLPKEYRKNRI